jgi:hypothetical protein
MCMERWYSYITASLPYLLSVKPNFSILKNASTFFYNYIQALQQAWDGLEQCFKSI